MLQSQVGSIWVSPKVADIIKEHTNAFNSKNFLYKITKDKVKLIFRLDIISLIFFLCHYHSVVISEDEMVVHGRHTLHGLLHSRRHLEHQPYNSNKDISFSMFIHSDTLRGAGVVRRQTDGTAAPQHIPLYEIVVLLHLDHLLFAVHQHVDDYSLPLQFGTALVLLPQIVAGRRWRRQHVATIAV